MAFRSLLASLVALVVLAACEPQDLVKVGRPAPELTATDLNGKAVKLADLRGKVVFVNFWWSGCGPCLVEMPEIEHVYRRLRNDGFEVLAVNIGQDEKTIKNTNRRLGVTYPLLCDRLKITTNQYNVAFAPTSFLIDRDGVIRERINGPLTRNELMNKVAKIL